MSKSTKKDSSLWRKTLYMTLLGMILPTRLQCAVWALNGTLHKKYRFSNLLKEPITYFKYRFWFALCSYYRCPIVPIWACQTQCANIVFTIHHWHFSQLQLLEEITLTFHFPSSCCCGLLEVILKTEAGWLQIKEAKLQQRVKLWKNISGSAVWIIDVTCLGLYMSVCVSMAVWGWVKPVPSCTDITECLKGHFQWVPPWMESSNTSDL